MCSDASAASSLSSPCNYQRQEETPKHKFVFRSANSNPSTDPNPFNQLPVRAARSWSSRSSQTLPPAFTDPAARPGSSTTTGKLLTPAATPDPPRRCMYILNPYHICVRRCLTHTCYLSRHHSNPSEEICVGGDTSLVVLGRWTLLSANAVSNIVPF